MGARDDDREAGRQSRSRAGLLRVRGRAPAVVRDVEERDELRGRLLLPRGGGMAVPRRGAGIPRGIGEEIGRAEGVLDVSVAEAVMAATGPACIVGLRISAV